ncbi:hemerythrin domain-containing protein [Pelomicrobium sp.]|jgi:hemerythrin-like domain-containing protein|uniref:hemerythrin domain-containing protein n=1 Tax=Pelomicrobium sp. TaxID=2815319 RepID=UPI002FDD4EF9
MVDILDALKKQHAHMRGMLQVIEKAIEDFGAGGRLDPYLADALLRYIAQFPKTVHRPVEVAVYQALGQADASLAALAETTAAEHGDLEARAEHLRALLFWSGQHPEFPRQLAVSMARALIGDLRRHMGEEEDRLFPVAEKRLDAAAWARVRAAAGTAGPAWRSRIRPLRRLFAQIAALTPPPPRQGKNVKPA